jgi:arsenical pump membrane protein
VGVVALVVSVALRPHDARAAAAQDWPPFVLVSGLLLIGLVAAADGLYAAAGQRLGRATRKGPLLFAGSVVLIVTVTATLNLDTSVAFLTPVLAYSARGRGGDGPLLYACLLLSNAGSLFLPGSNLTNLIVLGHLHLTGGQFLAHMWAPALVAALVTALVVGAMEHRALRQPVVDTGPLRRVTVGLGLLGVGTATVLVLVLRRPALPVLILGGVLVAVRLAARRERPGAVSATLGLPVLIGLFGVAVALGTLGRVWSGPAALLAHLDLWGTATLAALSSVVVNNLPAASLLAARTPDHPFALLVGLNVGPNLFVTGSLAWFLWLRAARTAQVEPSLWRASRIGLVTVPLALAGAVGTLALSGTR